MIRRAQETDAAALSELFTVLGYPTPAAVIPERLARILATDWATTVVAEANGTVIGMATGHVLPVLHSTGYLARLTAIVVAPGAQGRGVGRRLVEAIETWARSKGCPRIALTTALHRAGAHAFYERIGYVHTGRRYARVLDPDSP